MRPCAAFLLSFFLAASLQAQSYVTKKGWIEFAGEKPFEKVKADNTDVQSSLDPVTGAVEFHTMIRSFHFHNKKMEESFNKDYMESDKYPTSEFKGVITNIDAVNFSKKGDYPVTVDGDLTMHNITQHVTHPGTITVMADGSLGARSNFTVSLDDFKIPAPTMLGHKMVSEITVLVRMKFARGG